MKPRGRARVHGGARAGSAMIPKPSRSSSREKGKGTETHTQENELAKAAGRGRRGKGEPKAKAKAKANAGTGRVKFPDKLCHDIKAGRECSKGKDCEYSHDRHHFDENGKPKVKKVKKEKSSSAQAGTAEQPPSVHSSAAAGLTHTAFGSHSPQVQVEVASTRGGHRQRRNPPLVWRLPDTIKKLLEKFDAERQEEAQMWHDRMKEK